VAQTPFLLLNPQTDWTILSQSAGIQVGDDIRLQTLPGDIRPLADASGDLGGLTLPSALAIDSAERLYVLDGDKLARFDICTSTWEVLKGIGGRGTAARQFFQPRGMTISCRDQLIVADTGNRRVQIFQIDMGLSLSKSLGAYRVTNEGGIWKIAPAKPLPPDKCAVPGVPEFPDGTWQPSDVAITPDGTLYVSDTANGLIHVFDRWFRWVAAWEGRDDQGEPLTKPTHLALDAECNLYVVQDGVSDVIVLDTKGAFVRRVTLPTEVVGQFRTAGIGFDSGGRLHLTDPKTGCVLVFEPKLPEKPGQAQACLCHPMPPKCQPSLLAFDGKGGAALLDKLGGIVYALQESATFATEGSVIIGPLDSEQYRCVWHRVILDGEVQPGTIVQVDTCSADAPKLQAQIETMPDDRWDTRQMHGEVGVGRWDCLIRSQPGRYLWLRLTFYGDQQHTPSLSAIRVEYPRQSSLRYLPAVFREDAESAEFLDRFLSIIDEFWRQIGVKLDSILRLLNPLGTPAEFLPWLASWLGLVLEQNWSEDVKRRLIKNAHRLFKLRGMPAGLKLHIKLITGREPHILEHFKLRRWLFLSKGRLGDQVLFGAEVMDRLQLDVHDEIGSFQLIDRGDPLLDPLATYAHRFALYITLPNADEDDQRMIKEIVELAKPAHTQAEVVFVKPGLCLGRELFVGVNMVIGEYPSGVTLSKGTLGEGLVLSAGDGGTSANIQVGQKVRMGINARLES
jgi:phage tail-like protein